VGSFVGSCVILTI